MSQSPSVCFATPSASSALTAHLCDLVEPCPSLQQHLYDYNDQVGDKYIDSVTLRQSLT